MLDCKELGIKLTKKEKEFLEANPEVENYLLKNNKGEVWVAFPIKEFMTIYKKV